MPAVELKPAFGWVLGVAAGSYFVHHFYMSYKVVSLRKKFDVQYPAMYADEKNCPNEQQRAIFNCTQRAHQNSLENQPIFLSLLILSGLGYPVTAASFGALFLLGRIGYVEGYSSGDPKKRINAATAAGFFALLGLAGTTIKFAADLLLSDK